MHWALVSATVMFGLLAGNFQAGGNPAKMTHVIAEMSGTDIPKGSFAALPKTYWRASNRYCRVDEEPDVKNGIYGRTVINEPDAWLINLASRTAKHFVDQGPTFNCKLPIFAFDEEAARSKIGELEFGREFDFFQKNGATLVEGPKLSFGTNAYKLTIGNAVLLLVERVDIHAPILIALVRGNTTIQARYLLWNDQVPFDEKVFAKPTGVKIQDTN